MVASSRSSSRVEAESNEVISIQGTKAKDILDGGNVKNAAIGRYTGTECIVLCNGSDTLALTKF